MVVPLRGASLVRWFISAAATWLFACGGSTKTPALSLDASEGGPSTFDASADDGAETSLYVDGHANVAHDASIDADQADQSRTAATDGATDVVERSRDARSVDATTIDAVLDDGAASTVTTCGARTCDANEVCVHPPTSVGGPVPPCIAPADAGHCPPGTQFSSFCAGSGNGGCIAVYDPGPPSCAPIPASCATPLTCSCFASAVCGGNANLCTSVSGHDLRCANFAP